MSKQIKKVDQPVRLASSIDPDFDPISAALRQMHEGIANEPVPDDFLNLLDKLEERMAEKVAKP